MHKLIFFLTLMLLCPVSFAQERSPFEAVKAISFNGGLHTEFFNNVQVNSSGATRKFDTLPTLGAGLVLPFDDRFSFLPEINWVMPWAAGQGDSHIIKNLLMFRADFGYNLFDFLRLRLGTSLMWLNQHGRGGSVDISNGSSSSTFYYPDENHSSLNNTLDLGLEVPIDQWSVRLQTYTYSLFKEERRQISYTLMVTYYWEQKR